MKPFGKWLADFELPSKDEPEPKIEVIVNQGGDLPDWTHAQVIQWSPAFGAWENPAAVAAEDILRRALEPPVLTREQIYAAFGIPMDADTEGARHE